MGATGLCNAKRWLLNTSDGSGITYFNTRILVDSHRNKPPETSLKAATRAVKRAILFPETLYVQG